MFHLLHTTSTDHSEAELKPFVKVLQMPYPQTLKPPKHLLDQQPLWSCKVKIIYFLNNSIQEINTTKNETERRSGDSEGMGNAKTWSDQCIPKYSAEDRGGAVSHKSRGVKEVICLFDSSTSVDSWNERWHREGHPNEYHHPPNKDVTMQPFRLLGSYGWFETG